MRSFCGPIENGSKGDTHAQLLGMFPLAPAPLQPLLACTPKELLIDTVDVTTDEYCMFLHKGGPIQHIHEIPIGVLYTQTYNLKKQHWEKVASGG